LFFLAVPPAELVDAVLDERRAAPLGKEEMSGDDSDSDVEWDVLLWLDALGDGLLSGTKSSIGDRDQRPLIEGAGWVLNGNVFAFLSPVKWYGSPLDSMRV
jgi:hypothetical protein